MKRALLWLLGALLATTSHAEVDRAAFVAALLADGRPLRAIGPFGAQEQAFWQRPIEAQPDFLKAAVLERDRDWPGLEALTTAWSRAAPADAEPWYLQGLALAQLDRPSAARGARAFGADRAGAGVGLVPPRRRLPSPRAEGAGTHGARAARVDEH
jgi:hypothetical protein